MAVNRTSKTLLVRCGICIVMGKNRIAQLTWDDVINYDHGMRLGRLTFDEEGNRLLPDATLTERENTRRYNWLVREAHPITVKADLVAVWDQIGKWPANREVERTIPQIHFAENTGIIRLPLGLRHIVAHEAVTLDQAIHKPAKSPTVSGIKTGWQQSPFNGSSSAVYLLSSSFEELRHRLELRCGNRRSASFGTYQICRWSSSHNRGLSSCLLEFYTYLVLAQGKMNGLIGLSEVLFMQDKQNYSEPLLKLSSVTLAVFDAGLRVRPT